MNTPVLRPSNGLLFGAVMALFAATEASATPILYKDRAAFDAAIAGISGVGADVTDFEGVSGGTLIPSGSSFDGIGFSYSIPGNPPYQIGVNSTAGGTSGQNYLGVSNDGGTNFSRFALGDSIDFTFADSHAFGMYIIVGQGFSFFDDDINLSFAGTTLSNLASDVSTLVNGVDALFVGIVDTATTYTSANLTFGAPGATSGAFFEIDDIVKTEASTTGGPPTTTVPEPGMLSLLGLGMIGLAMTRRKRSA